MESRLPKPKINLVKAKSTLSVAGGSKILKTTGNSTLASQSTSNITNLSSMSTVSSSIKNTASTSNIHNKNGSENQPPKETGMLRSKTMSTILRQRPTLKAPVKRLGTAVNAIEVKRPNLTQRVVNKPTVTTNNAKPPPKPVAKPPAKSAAKPLAKWDLKGRLAYTVEELASIKDKNKEMSTKYNEMQEMLQTLQESESFCKARAEELECSNKKLNEDLISLKTELEEYRSKNEDLTRNLKEIEEKYNNVCESLKEYKEKSSQQEDILKDQKIRLEEYDGNLKAERDRNEKLTTTNEDLQILVHSMDKDRRVLHNAMQEMKGNIRVFCRVRPTIPKETSKPYVDIYIYLL